MEKRERTNPGSNKIKIPGPKKDMSSVGTGSEILKSIVNVGRASRYL